MSGSISPGGSSAASPLSSPKTSQAPAPAAAGAAAPPAATSSASPLSNAAANDTVGTVLAAIATSLSDAIRTLMFADKRQWGPDEFEQTRALEEALDEAKRDFQAMSRLVNGQFFYERDRNSKSVEELRNLNTRFSFHGQNFKDWSRAGGPINPTWVLETVALRRDLHRTQCRAACRIFATGPGPARCLGAFQVQRRQRELQGLVAPTAAPGSASSGRRESTRTKKDDDGVESIGMLSPGAATAIDLEQGVAVSHAPNQPRHQQMLSPQLKPGFLMSPPPGKGGGAHSPNGNNSAGQQNEQLQPPQAQPASPPPQGPQATPFGLEALVPECNAIGGFEKFGDRDVAFACDYCDGFLVWEDLDRMPSRTRNLEQQLQHPSTANGGYGYYGGYPDWQAEALSVSTGEPKCVVFAPVAIANHLPPDNGDWRARVMCPYCDEYTYFEQGEEGGETRYAQDEEGLLGLIEFQEHLEWYHGAGLLPMPTMPTKKTNCAVM
ncbi:hypothetical protein GGTG_07874 [Gaeumannomyces tritici R3-111a-1]|uniref:Uncharacterized protein n=1 Tax=Gaeumannomyces tritici (strain R3-111a-1) TaxID=644352 RepID=J3P2Y3_GAET3|nr:hypothetical protein GGTG_07874 [Gaeumannomyces tritici R3-111a-1]EJT74025.1 hypothetical protein GGTG_07874 [Gaeumannomyces tritici R3-111a-1]